MKYSNSLTDAFIVYTTTLQIQDSTMFYFALFPSRKGKKMWHVYHCMYCIIMYIPDGKNFCFDRHKNNWIFYLEFHMCEDEDISMNLLLTVYFKPLFSSNLHTVLMHRTCSYCNMTSGPGPSLSHCRVRADSVGCRSIPRSCSDIGKPAMT